MPQGRGKGRKRKAGKAKPRRKRLTDPLARLQVAALTAGGMDGPDGLAQANDMERILQHVDVLRELAESHGFEVVGIGSSRFTVKLGDDRIAKLAWTLPGVTYNQNGACKWQFGTPEVRRAIAPCLTYRTCGVLIQPFIEPVSPRVNRLDEMYSPENEAARRAAALTLMDEINAARVAAGNKPTDVRHVRLDNYGRTTDGRLVNMDYGNAKPTVNQYAWLYRNSAARDLHLEADLDASPIRPVEPPLRESMYDLTRRVGWPADDRTCPECYSGKPWARCHGQIPLSWFADEQELAGPAEIGYRGGT